MQPVRAGGKLIHQIGLPYHWGTRGRTKGDSANDAFPLVLDPNVFIEEVKAATCDIRAGRKQLGRNS
jgi:formate dehydrogenase major subunit